MPCGVRQGIPPEGRRRGDQADRASLAARQDAEPALGSVLRGGPDALVFGVRASEGTCMTCGEEQRIH